MVADEVRGLARKTTESTETIRTLVERLQGEASESVRSMNNNFSQLAAVRTLMASVSEGAEKIRSAMARIHQGADQTRLGMDEQESVSKSVARQVNEISNSANASLDEIDEHCARASFQNSDHGLSVLITRRPNFAPYCVSTLA